MYRKVLKENTFVCMEYSRQSYEEIMGMPVKKFYDYITWKNDLEDKKQKQLEEIKN